MMIYEKRYIINNKINEKISQKFGDVWFNAYGLAFDGEEESHKRSLNIFKYVFSLKTKDSEIYLWNACNKFISNSDCLKYLNREEFSEEEFAFLENMAKVKRSVVSFSGKEYACTENVNKPFSTERLIIKPLTEKEEKAYNDFFKKNKHEYTNYYMLKWSKFDSLLKNKNLTFGIFLKDDDTFIGTVALTGITEFRYNLAYFIFPKYRKKGYASESVRAVCDKAVKRKLSVASETLLWDVYRVVKPDIKCIQFKIATDNFASIKLAERVGAKSSGVLKYEIELGKNSYDMAVYYLCEE